MTETQANPDTLAAGSGLINWFWVSIELNHAMHRRHRLQGCLGFAWVSYVIMPAAEELFAKAGRGGLSPLRKAPPRGAASAGSRHEIRKTGAAFVTQGFHVDHPSGSSLVTKKASILVTQGGGASVLAHRWFKREPL